MRSRRVSITVHTRLYFAGTVLLSLLVAFGVFWAAWSRYSVATRAEELSGQVVAVARGQEVAAASGTGSLRDQLFRVQAGLLGAQLFVTDAEGTIERSSSETELTRLPLERLGAADDRDVRSGTLRTSGEAGTLLLVVAPIDAERNLVAVQALREVRDAERGLLVLGALAAIAGAIVAWLAAGVLARRLTAPLRRLEAGAERVSSGEWGVQVAEEGDVETASLARSFNTMSERVADAYAAQKEFVGDVSHEFRTPLTSIRGFAEAMLDGTIESDEGRTHALEVIKAESMRLGGLAQTLLGLAELDAGSVRMRADRVDTRALGDAIHDRFDRPAAEARLSLEIDLRSAGAPVADPDALLQAVSALVANALAYTPADGSIRISATEDVDRWRLHVDDSGPGIPPDKREAVFGRFARLDASRASASGGAGLGLPICQRIVELMRGTVSAADSPLGGARFTIDLPMWREEDGPGP